VEDIDLDLRGIFQKMANESRENIDELSAEIRSLGWRSSYRHYHFRQNLPVWMDIKATFTGHDRTSVLESCEYGEDAAQEAYDDALATRCRPAGTNSTAHRRSESRACSNRTT
jgi:uncharacterized protein (TIGR02284 family)